jgi:periplasmic protein TonB
LPIVVVPNFRSLLRPPRLAALAAVPSDDRFGVSLFGSLLVHILVILGVGFVWPKLRSIEGLPTLEITLVQTASERAPKNPDFLANANQDGGGASDQRGITSSPFPVREITDSRRDIPTVFSLPQKAVPSTREVDKFLSFDTERLLHANEPRPEKKDVHKEPFNPGLIENAKLEQEAARLNSEISRDMQDLQKRPRRKFLNARTQEYKYAAYMDAWRAKVERIGNLNYPEEAKRRHLTGDLVLEVALGPDGNVRGMNVLRSSGHKLLDDAAMRIVELAAPFAPFPPDVRAETDEICITRTWKFNESLETSN